MHAQDLLVDAGTDRHTIEGVAEGLPELDVVAALAIIVEPVDSGNTGTFVVPTKGEEVFRVLVL
jgi:hypothetical protein